MERVGSAGWYRIAGLTCCLAALSVTTAAAQTGRPDLRVGDVIRIQLTEARAKWSTGAVVGSDSDSVRFIASSATDTTAVALTDLRRWQVSRGTSRGTARGALRGFVYGALTSGVAAAMVPNPEASGLSAEGFYGAVAAAGGVLGAGLGALIGADHHRWGPVVRPLHAEHAGTIREEYRRTGVGITASF